MTAQRLASLLALLLLALAGSGCYTMLEKPSDAALAYPAEPVYDPWWYTGACAPASPWWITGRDGVGHRADPAPYRDAVSAKKDTRFDSVRGGDRNGGSELRSEPPPPRTRVRSSSREASRRKPKESRSAVSRKKK
jgi:hypothetical protein